MLEIIFSGKTELHFFPFTPKLSNLVVVITEETDFNTRYCRSKLPDSNKGKKQGSVVAIGAVLKNGFHCN